MKNNKGFTLVEMLVVIVLVVALSASAGLSADFSLKQTRKRGYKDTYFDLFKAVDFYSELSSFSCSTISTGCEVEISDLIASGLIDNSILETINPIYEKNEVYFNNTSKFTVTKKNGQKAIQFKCESSNLLSGDCSKTACIIAMNGIYDSSNYYRSSYTLDSYHDNDYWRKC